MHPTHRHTLLYRLADPRTTASERETLRAELAAGRDLPQETVAEWIRPRIVLAPAVETNYRLRK